MRCGMTVRYDTYGMNMVIVKRHSASTKRLHNCLNHVVKDDTGILVQARYETYAMVLSIVLVFLQRLANIYNTYQVPGYKFPFLSACKNVFEVQQVLPPQKMSACNTAVVRSAPGITVISKVDFASSIYANKRFWLLSAIFREPKYHVLN